MSYVTAAAKTNNASRALDNNPFLSLTKEIIDEGNKTDAPSQSNNKYYAIKIGQIVLFVVQ